MNRQELIDTARALVAGDKGLLAMDESNPTCNKRFARLGIPQTGEARRAYRELIVTTPGLGDCISGAILYDETIRQRKKDGTSFVKAIGEQQYQVRLTDRGQDGLEDVDKVADATVRCLLRAVTAAVPGIAFLSGGQPAELASARLNAMNVRFKSRLPWALAFSFARAIQQPALEIWKGDEAHVSAAQQALYHRAGCNRAARRGEYTAAMERA
jgi:fructose-bisphosphate aldolase class 1